MWKEFKDFISRGNVIDLAVGVIIGSAFSAIVTSLVDNIISPVIGIIIGGLDFSGLSLTVGSAHIMYGAFIQAIINFLIIAFVLFLIVKLVNTVHKPKEEVKEKSAEEIASEKELALLTEIRDALVSKESTKK